jgi:beta-1,4-mannosyl-glycoprotein beta-1,4-N-acetylglucosaminyltransferase
MARPLIVDAFPFNNELDMLEMRLVELYDAVDHFVLVEAPVDHQDHTKPLWYADNAERFAPWADKIIHVVAKREELPTLEQDPDPWGREHAQREVIGRGLAEIEGLTGTTIVLQSDVDEIPRALQVRNIRPNGKMLSFEQRLHCFAIDWQHPDWWYGTVAAEVSTLLKMPKGREFSWQRDARLRAECPPHLRNAGWHFSWLGGKEAALAKLGSFCHPEIAERTETLLTEDVFLREGYHVDGQKQLPVDVDETWPRWITEGHAPSVWYRPR